MSVATQVVPDVFIPDRARRYLPERLATVTVLCPPRDPAPAALRLTRRGVAVLTLVVAAIGAGVVWLATASGSSPASPAPASPHAVTVQSGDTLWSIAARVAPQRDPRAEVDALQRHNHLPGAALTPGQVLRVP